MSSSSSNRPGSGRRPPRLGTGVLVLLLVCSTGRAEDWPQFRGPRFDGSSLERGLPSRLAPDAPMRFSLDLPGPSAGTPVVVGDRLYLPAFDAGSGEALALAVDPQTGRLLWRVSATRGREDGSRGRENTLCESSPVADGTGAWFLFGDGVIVSLDRDGAQRWRRDLGHEYGPFRINFGYAASPLLHEGRLYVSILHRGPSRLLALDPATGDEVFDVVRPTAAVGESQEAYTTPVPFTHGGRTTILVLGGDRLTGHDPATGAEVFSTDLNPRRASNHRIVPSPVVSGPWILVNEPQMDPLRAYLVGEEGIAPMWSYDEHVTDVPTPALVDGRVVLLAGRKKRISALELTTGAPVWSRRLQGLEYLRASPLVADGKIYVVDANGTVVVLQADTGEETSRGAFDDYPTRAGLIAAAGGVFLRTASRLMAFD